MLTSIFISTDTSPKTTGTFVDQVEKCSAETDALFVSWVISNAPLGIIEEQVGSDSYKAFARFMVLADQANEADIDECIARLRTASPRTAALLLVVLLHQNDLKLLPTIVRSLDNARIAFHYPKGSPDRRYAWQISGSEEVQTALAGNPHRGGCCSHLTRPLGISRECRDFRRVLEG